MPETTTETPAARGLKAALTRNAKQKAEKQRARAAAAAPAPAAPIAPARPKAKWQPPKTDAEKAEFQRMHARFLAVAAHPAFDRQKSAALKLFGNLSLSVAEVTPILDMLAAENTEAKNSALSEMRAALQEARAHASSHSSASLAGGSAAIWDRAIAATFESGEASA